MAYIHVVYAFAIYHPYSITAHPYAIRFIVKCIIYTSIIHVCSTMRGRIKGTDSSINSILQKVGIYRTGREFMEPEAVRKSIPMPSLAFYHCFSCYKPVKTPSLVQYGNCRTRSMVSTVIKLLAVPRALSRLDHAPHSTIPVLHSRRCFNIVEYLYIQCTCN